MTTTTSARWGKISSVLIAIGGTLAILALFAAVALPTLLLPRSSDGDGAASGELTFKPQLTRTETVPPRWQIQLQNAAGDSFVFTVAGAGQRRFQAICDQGFVDSDQALTWLLAVDADADGFISTLEAVNSGEVRDDVIARAPPPVSGDQSTAAASPAQPTQPAPRAQPTQPAARPQPVQPPRGEPRPTLRDKIDPGIVNFWMLRRAGEKWVLEVNTTNGPAAFRYGNRADADTDIEWLEAQLDAEE